MANVLISGAGGWLGRRLTHLIARREFRDDFAAELPPSVRIRALLHPTEDSASLEDLGIELVRGDLRDPDECAAFCQGSHGALLFHTAGLIHPRRVKEFYQVNRDGSQNMLRAAAQAGVRRAVVVSSNSPFGVNPHNENRFDESSPFRPYMHYGRSKMQLELLVHAWERSGQLETVIVRAPWFYGPSQPRRQTLFFSMVRTGRVPIVGSGENLRSMAYLDNLCEGMLLAALSDRARGQTYWIADSRPYSMNEIVATVENLLEQEFGLQVAHKRLHLPRLASSAATVADAAIQGLGLYHQKIHVLSEMDKTIACSIVKAQSELCYDPKISLEEGMRRSIADCLARGVVI